MESFLARQAANPCEANLVGQKDGLPLAKRQMNILEKYHKY